MVNEVFAFVYSKRQEIKVLSSDNAREEHSTLIADGWKHTQTLNACIFIQNLYNNCNDLDLYDEIKSLGTANF